MKYSSRKDIPSSGPRHPKRGDNKPGRIVNTIWGYGPDLLSDFDDPTKLPRDALEPLVEGLAWSARTAIRQRFALDPVDDLSISSLIGLVIPAYTGVSRVIADAGIPMIGWSGAPKDWPDYVVSTEGMVFESAASLAAGEFYEFDSDGALVLAHFDDPSYRILVRHRGDQEPITLEEALGAMAALLKAFARLRLSLTGDANQQVLDWLSKLASDARSFAEHLRHPYARALRNVGSRALEAFNEQFANRIDQVRSFLEGQKEPEARIQLIGPLQNCYQLLFGRAATVDETRTGTPFIRFATRFFREVGCPCAPGTVGAALDAWRRRPAEVKVPVARIDGFSIRRPARPREPLPSAKIIDLQALAAYLAHINHPQLIELLERLAGEGALPLGVHRGEEGE